MADYDISFRGNAYRRATDIVVPPGVSLVSFDNGIVHAQSQRNGMSYVIAPSGKGGSAMIRRLCVGGSRLENAKWAGACHVLEHADFRTLDWLKFGGIDKNASTSKTFIDHQAYLLLDPAVGHVRRELDFQHQTMLGRNLIGLSMRDIKLEIDNVLDERDFNAQAGAAYRTMIMKVEELLLPRVWGGNAYVGATIGNDISLSNIHDAQDLMTLHHMFRAPQRTHLVISGPVDINSTLALFNNRFGEVPLGDESVLRAIPPSTAPTATGRRTANVSTNAGTRYLAIGGIKGAYSPDADVSMIIQHLASVLGGQPAVKQHGVSDVMLYFNPESQTGCFSLLAKVTMQGAEEAAMVEAQHALEEHVIAPLRTFGDRGVLGELLSQYRTSIKDTLASGPQEVAALAIQGILACGKPSLAWHVEDRFADDVITPERVREVANLMFNEEHLAVVRCTESDGSVAPAGIVHDAALSQSWLEALGLSQGSTRMPVPALSLAVSCAHHTPDSGGARADYIAPPVYVRPGNVDNIEQVVVRNESQDEVAKVAYNKSFVYPLHKQSISCAFGTVADYGGWAQATLVTSAMNVIAKVVGANKCKYELQGTQLLGTVDYSALGQHVECGGGCDAAKPLVTTVAVAAALSGAAGEVRGLGQLRTALPAKALEEAVESVSKQYQSPSWVAQAQTRSQMCSPSDAGYIPSDLGTAVRMLGSEHSYVLRGLRSLYDTTPHLVGTNVTVSDLIGTVRNIATVASEVQKITKTLTPDIVRQRLVSARTPDIRMIQTMQGLRTYPYVASTHARIPLDRADRACFIVSNQVMVGGMGSVYTHDLRQRGVSYRPAGGIRLGWQQRPVIMLHATFDATQADQGRGLTTDTLSRWCAGDERIFTPAAIRQAKTCLQEQLQLRNMDYDVQKFSLLAELDPAKYGAREVVRAISQVDASSVRDTMRRYFGPRSSIKESWVALDDRVLIARMPRARL